MVWQELVRDSQGTQGLLWLINTFQNRMCHLTIMIEQLLMVDMICRLNITQVTILSSAGYQKPSFAFLITTELEKQSNWVVRFATWGSCEFYFIYIYIYILYFGADNAFMLHNIKFILLRLRDNSFYVRKMVLVSELHAFV
jgi:hypothetical protein